MTYAGWKTDRQKETDTQNMYKWLLVFMHFNVGKTLLLAELSVLVSTATLAQIARNSVTSQNSDA